MKAAIMQPYILPYIGYFQLIGAVDVFIVYDNIQYTKKGWINRNRFLSHSGGDAMFSLPLKKDSTFKDVIEREISTDFAPDKLLNQLKEAYRRAPYAEPTLALLRAILSQDERNLFLFLRQALELTCRHIGITTPIVTSSTLAIDHTLQSQDKVIALCRSVGATTYINSIGGTALYRQADFAASGLDLQFLRPLMRPYTQFGGDFVPWLSILDALMFNAPDTVLTMVRDDFELVAA